MKLYGELCPIPDQNSDQSPVLPHPSPSPKGKKERETPYKNQVKLCCLLRSKDPEKDRYSSKLTFLIF